MTNRIDPASPPFTATVQTWLDRTMPPGMPPLVLFTTLARDERLFERFMRGGLLDSGNLTLRQRELVIGRVTAQCGSEYEWGVHVTVFGGPAGLTADERASLVSGGPDDSCWSEPERCLLRACDSLHDTCDVDEARWSALRLHLSDCAMIEVLMLAGYYRTVSYLTNALRLPLEQFAARFPARPR